MDVLNQMIDFFHQNMSVDLSSLWRAVMSVVSVVIVVALLKRFRRKGSKARERLLELGFRVVNQASGPTVGQLLGHSRRSRANTRYLGTFGGWPAGYLQGPGAVTGLKGISNWGSALGRAAFVLEEELWLELGFTCKPLALVERWDRLGKTLAKRLVGGSKVRLGDAAFDKRFTVWCADAAWAKTLLGPSERATLLARPYLLLIMKDQRVFFPLAPAYGGKALRKLGLSLHKGHRPVQMAEQFLGSLALVAEAARDHTPGMSQPRPTSGGAASPSSSSPGGGVRKTW